MSRFNHRYHCRSLRGPWACTCGAEYAEKEREVNNVSGCKRSADDTCDSVKSRSAADIPLAHLAECKATKGDGECNCEAVSPVDEGDGVKAPSHYQLFEGLEAIEVIARSMTTEMFKGYCLGNILKYRLRAGKKSELATLEKDMAKATFYLELYTKHKGLCYDAE